MNGNDGYSKCYIVHRVHEHERIHAHNHHNEVTFSSCSWMNYCTQKREWAGLSTDSATATLTLAKGLDRWVGSVGDERRSWQNLLGSNASPFARIQRMKLK